MQMPTRPVLIISGTNRPGSNTRLVAKLVEEHYKSQNLPSDFFDLVDLPCEVFEPTAYTVKPASIVAIQQRILDAAGLHVVTPEYNGSFPGILKYFIDLLKFPESFDRKPVAFVGVAAGMFAALRPVEQLQMIFSYRNAHIYPDRVFIATVKEKLSPEGRLIDAGLDQRLARQAAGFTRFAAAFSSDAPPS
jgi:chromate reductase, NAD(P)H dehydrogenase (quinone)